MTGLYIHVPFCRRKCPYCDFYSVEFLEEMSQSYVNAVVRNIKAYGDKSVEIDTVYFGGGTPSTLTSAQINEILRTTEDSFSLSNPEITLEANPSSTDLDKLCELKKAGVNRLSFGVQSACDDELKMLGRLHSFEQARNVVLNAQKVGFENISCDLMIGVPMQTAKTLKHSIDALCELPIKHISAYMLKIEEKTPFDCEEIRSKSACDDELCELYKTAVERLGENGFSQYEISNFAVKGFESRHNLKYWHCEEYIGIGPSAHSFYKNNRYFVPRSLKDFLQSPRQNEVVAEEAPDKLEEYILLSLRLNEGVSLEKIELLGGDKNAFLQLAKPLEQRGLLKIADGRVTLTTDGFLVSNAIIAHLLG